MTCSAKGALEEASIGENQESGPKAASAAGSAAAGIAASVLAWLVGDLGISLSPAVVRLLVGVAFVAGIAFSYVYARYNVILTRKGPDENQAYLALRRRLIEGGLPQLIYAERLKAALSKIDRFLGDADLQAPTLWPRAFGLQTPASLWTAPAFDRCLLLALLYPVLTIILIWAISGRAGPAERALLLPPDFAAWHRVAAVAMLIIAPWAAWRGVHRTSGWRRVLWFGCALALLVAGGIAGAGSAAVTFAIVSAVATPFVRIGEGTFAFPATVAVTFALAFAVAFVLPFDFLVPIDIGLVVSGSLLAGILGMAAHGTGCIVVLIALGILAISGGVLIAVTREGKVALAIIAIVVVGVPLVSALVQHRGFRGAVAYTLVSIKFAAIVAAVIGVAVGIPTVFAVAIAGAFAGASPFAAPFAAAIPLTAVIVGLMVLANYWFTRELAQGLFQILFVLSGSLLVFFAAGSLASQDRWQISGPLLLFLGVLTLINAPFNWLSVGLTRALLRRGLELSGWYPYLLAIFDALCAGLLILLLTIISVLSIQLFEDLAVHLAGERASVLPLGPLLDGIAAHPSAPELWWVYALLLSVISPSLVNLTIAGASLLRGVPWITSLLLRAMPEAGPPAAFDRPWITLVLTLQLFAGAAIGVMAQALLAYVVIWSLPPVGLNLLDLARVVAEPDFPGWAINAVEGVL